jgi:hypothetical protein
MRRTVYVDVTHNAKAFVTVRLKPIPTRRCSLPVGRRCYSNALIARGRTIGSMNVPLTVVTLPA